LILGANSASGGYNVANSLRFNSGSSDYLNRTLGTPTSRRIWTTSFWVKRSQLSTEQYMFLNAYNDGTNRQTNFTFTNDTLELQLVTGGAYSGRIITNALYRDISAWYHVILAIDTTQATDTNRIKLYVNGSQVTSFSTATYPAQNFDTSLANTRILYIGATNTPTASFNGYLSEYYFIDGQQLTPSSFGQTDPSTPSSGIWIPKAYTGSFGTNGFYLQFKNSAALGTDSSGNGNTFTVNNLTSVDQSTDTPTNNFCTGNPLFAHNNTPTFSNGNLTIVTATGDSTVISTIGVTTGKWYFEAKIGSTAVGASIGILGGIESIQNTGSNLTFYPQGFAYYVDGRKYNNNVGSLYGDSYTTGDIIGVAFDLTNGKIWFSKNGTFQASGDPAAGTNAAFTTLSSTVTYFPAFGDASGGSTSTFDCNFGSPPYSANSYTDGAGYGNFSYAVPSGFYSLNTKNLANFG
jgi:hypothetical protein